MSEHTVEQPAVKRLERSRSDRMLAGVCGGLARYFDINPAFYRVGFVVLTLLGGAGFIVYAAAALVIPDEGEQDSIASAALRDRRDRPWPLIGLALIGVAGAVLLSRATIWPHGDAAWILLVLAGVAILSLARHRPSEERVDRPFPSGAEASMDTAAEAPTVVARRPGRLGRWVRGIGFTFGVAWAMLLTLAAIGAAVLHVHLSHGVGSKTYNVASYADLQKSYSLGVGDLNVDLSSVRFPAGQTHVEARVDVGRLAVVVPPHTAIHVHAKARYGEVKLFGVSANGHDADRTIREPGVRVLDLDLYAGAGKVVVTRAVR
ncbi:MAG TPA: PspC domain-containing protein [Gaiellaceae bacterium]